MAAVSETAFLLLFWVRDAVVRALSDRSLGTRPLLWQTAFRVPFAAVLWQVFTALRCQGTRYILTCMVNKQNKKIRSRRCSRSQSGQVKIVSFGGDRGEI